MLEETELKAGKFGVIRSLLRALDGGAVAKAVLDAAIDACAAMQVGCVVGLVGLVCAVGVGREKRLEVGLTLTSAPVL